MKRHTVWIPSVMTLANLGLGFAALLLNHPSWSLLFILCGCLLDVFDGIVARRLQVDGPFGKELDALADLVAFGVAPAGLVYQHCLPHSPFYLLLVTLLPMFCAIRLARFNLDSRQKNHFLGLPTPANGLFFASLPYLQASGLFPLSESLTILLILVFSLLMVAPIRMFAFKDLRASGPATFIPLLFLSLTLLGSFFLSLFVIPAGVMLYIVLSLVYHLLTRTKTKPA